jgi:aminoglycoside phosphotransferase family enzyme/predicted kinase
MSFEISSMLNPNVYDHAVKRIELIETHISWVILTGYFAYKIKKPVDFGFLDFSTLDKRHIFCEQEILLNRRMAPDIYLDVVAISSIQGKPVISGTGRAVEYAVKMVQFPQSSQLDHMLLSGELTVEHMEPIARMVADFHQSVQVAEDDATDYGSADMVYQPVEENFTQINQHMVPGHYATSLNELKLWSKSEGARLRAVFDQRKRDGFVRECHGDMHLRNLVWLDGQPMAFDCIEFDPGLRWIDVICDIAFLVMDLHDREETRLANRLLNSYLEVTGDYAGLSVLPFYLCYRALVRAKVDAFRLEQPNVAEHEREQSRLEFESYIELATRYTRRQTPRLIIMRGVSASGKSTVSRHLLDSLGAIRIRSDIERKRLFNVERAGGAPGEVDIYSEQATRETYEKLAELAAGLIGDGYSVIVDATFLEYEQRKQFQSLASCSGIPYAILETWAPDEVLRRRIVNRKHDVSDADIAVLENQLINRRLLHEDEQGAVISLNTAKALEIDTLIAEINRSTTPQVPRGPENDETGRG